MKIVNTGIKYQIYDDSLRTFDSLPAATYCVRFSKLSGFYLESRPNMQVNETVYGPHESKVEKVIASYNAFTRSLGVILSGAKGIGKSMFARLLSTRAISAGLPVLIVDEAIPGIASYLESIDQEVMILFDEFDKTFAHPSDDDKTDIINVNLLSKTKELYLHKLVDHLFSNRKSPNFANTQIQQGADPLPSCLPVLILLPAIIIAAITTGKQPVTPSVNGRPRK